MEPLKKFDVSTDAARTDRYTLFEIMRETAPVVELAPLGHLAVTRYEDVVSVLMRPEVFSSSGWARNASNVRNLIASDPPDHTRLRGLVSQAFTPRMIERLKPQIEAIAADLVEQVAADRSFDLMSRIAGSLPVRVIAGMLGVDEHRQSDFVRWGDDMVTTISMAKVDRARVEKSKAEFYAYLQSIIAARKDNPEDDLISVLVQAEVDGTELSDAELLAFVSLLLLAGVETTIKLIGNAWVALTDHPEEMAKVMDSPALIPPLVEETLRYHTPQQCVFRRAKADTEIAGTPIPAGSTVAPLLASANRDPSKFPAPARFDVTRDARAHLAFGFGPHYCLAANLARWEARIVLETMFAKLGPLEREQPDIEWINSFTMRGPERLVLRRS